MKTSHLKLVVLKSNIIATIGLMASLGFGTSQAQEGNPCYARSTGCPFPYDSTNYAGCSWNGEVMLPCRVGYRDVEATCCTDDYTHESGVKCKSPQLFVLATVKFREGISSRTPSGSCVCTDMEQEERDGTDYVPQATFDSTGCVSVWE